MNISWLTNWFFLLLSLALWMPPAVLSADSLDRDTGDEPRAAVSSVNSGEQGPRPESIRIPDGSGGGVFGANLFSGAFSRESYSGFNPNYVVNIGDRLDLKMWGAYDFEKTLTVDAQGNIFIPRVGPVKVAGVRNSELEAVVAAKIRQVYKSNVGSYVNLAAAQPVKIFVTGFVRRPGMYSGLSSDSLLYYLDRAGGVDPDHGSYIDIEISRDSKPIKKVNLYSFILEGKQLNIQFHDGDTIIVAPRRHVVSVEGLVQNAYQFEFGEPIIHLEKVLKLADVKPEATHVRIVRNTGSYRNIDYYQLSSIGGVLLNDGDEVLVTSDKKPGTISVRVEGEHDSPQEYVLPYGSTLGELLERIQYSAASDRRSISLYRKSVKRRQQEMLRQSLKTLESTVLTAKSATSGEVAIRKGEADLVLQWIQRAKTIEARGQVVLGDYDRAADTILENGDVIKIPSVSNLVMVSGEVLFPVTTVYDPKLELLDYIERAGGFVQNEKAARVVVLHRNGAFTKVKKPSWGSHLKAEIEPGDEILVLPKIDLKKLQISKDFTQVLYQIAVAAGVVLSL